MTNEERDLIGKFISRVAGQPQSGAFLAGPSGSVPQAQAPLPPVDADADAFIAQQFQQYPQASYRITQTALVQEAAFAESQNRIRRLEWELEQTRQQMQQQQQQAPQQNRGIFGGLFGGGGGQQPQQGYARQFQPTSPPPQPQYPPNYQPGMFQQGGGSSFLGSALTTAAGVAGGMVVGNALMNAFSGHGGGMGGGGMFGGGGQMASNTGSAFDGAGVSTVGDPTAGFAGASGFDQPVSDPYGSGGEPKQFDQSGGGFDQGGDTGQGNTDQGGSGAWDGGGGGFDPGGFDDNT